MGLSQLNQKVEAILRRSCEGSVESLSGKAVFRLDHRSRMLRVQAGQIWLSWEGDDYLLNTDEEMFFPAGTEDAVISVPHGGDATFELLCVPSGA